MVSWMCVRGVVVMVVMRWVRSDACVRYWIGRESEHVERGWSVVQSFVVVVMVMMMWMYVVMVMGCLRLL